MGILHRNSACRSTSPPETHRAASRYGLGEIDDLRHFRCRGNPAIRQVLVETIRTPHDGADGVAFVVDDGQHRLGILTDLGHVFAGLEASSPRLNAVLLESNYDPEMLADGPYPEWLKHRIRGPGGHIER